MTSRPENPTVAVLGGTGWIGRNVCQVFARNGYRVLVLARNATPHIRGCTFVSKNLRSIDPHDLAEVLRAHETGVIVNAVDALNATDGREHDARSLHEGNVGQVERLLKALKGWNRPPRPIHLDTVHEYGDLPRPQALSERKARARRRGLEEGKITVTVARAHRDYANACGLARAVFLAARVPEQGFAIPPGNGTVTSMEDFVHTFADAAGLPREVVQLFPTGQFGMGGSWILVDPEPAERRLGRRTRIGLADSLRAMCETDLTEVPR